MVTEPGEEIPPSVELGVPRLDTACPFIVDAVVSVETLEGTPAARVTVMV